MTVLDKSTELVEGQFFAELDEVYAEKKSAKTGKPFYMAAFRREGVGTGDMFVSEDVHRRLRGLTRGDHVLLTFTLSKREGQLQTYLQEVRAL